MSHEKVINDQGETVKAGCLVIEDGKVLLVLNASGTVGQFPKGHAEVGESPEEVAVRETLEETGYRVKIIRQLPDVTYMGGEQGDAIRLHTFLGRVIEKTADPGEEKWAWVEIDRAKEILFPNLIKLLEEI